MVDSTWTLRSNAAGGTGGIVVIVFFYMTALRRLLWNLANGFSYLGHATFYLSGQGRYPGNNTVKKGYIFICLCRLVLTNSREQLTNSESNILDHPGLFLRCDCQCRAQISQ